MNPFIAQQVVRLRRAAAYVGLVWFVISCIYSITPEPKAHDNTKERKKRKERKGRRKEERKKERKKEILSPVQRP